MIHDEDAQLSLSAVLRALGVRDQSGSRLLATNFRKSVWRVETPDGPCVVRLLAPSEERAAAHEREVLLVARSSGVPAPFLRAHATVQGRPALLLSWSDGRTLAAESRARPWSVRRLGMLMGEQQARVHRVRASFSDSVAWYDCFGTADAAMRERLEAVQTPEPRLLHLDYHADNVILSGRSITGILDWENAVAGDPRADVARTWSLSWRRPSRRRRYGS